MKLFNLIGSMPPLYRFASHCAKQAKDIDRNIESSILLNLTILIFLNWFWWWYWGPTGVLLRKLTLKLKHLPWKSFLMIRFLQKTSPWTVMISLQEGRDTLPRTFFFVKIRCSLILINQNKWGCVIFTMEIFRFLENWSFKDRK